MANTTTQSAWLEMSAFRRQKELFVITSYNLFLSEFPELYFYCRNCNGDLNYNRDYS